MSAYNQAWSGPAQGINRPTNTDYSENEFGFSEVDDLIQQTLNTLQDLDIPMGPSQTYSNPYAGHMNMGHKKQPSGTAIFGFANHNKVLSIPGIDMSKSQAEPRQMAAPGQYAFKQPPPPFAKQEPVLFASPGEFEASYRPYEDQRGPTFGMYEPQLYPPQPPSTFQAPPCSQPLQTPQPPHAQLSQQPPHTQLSQQPPHSQRSNMGHISPGRRPDDDFYITGNQPNQYKFPMRNTGWTAPPKMAPLVQEKPKTVEVPVEYLRKLTSMIKNTDGASMDNFLNYELDKFIHSGPPRAREDRDGSQTVAASSSSSEASTATDFNSREPSPTFSEIASVNHSIPSPIKRNVTVPALDQNGMPSPLKPSTFIHTKAPATGLGLMVDLNNGVDQQPESEFVITVPKTPSPTLGSQATFTPSPKKGLSWRPVVTSDKSSMLQRKTQDKASTLPPGEIDLYISGPLEDKRYVCNYKGCGKKFTRRYNVRSHVQTHLCDRPFVCEHEGCNKAFVRLHDLTRHHKIHEEFAFRCDCGKKFSRQDALFRHRARNICSGGLEPQEVQRLEMRATQTSVKKKKQPRPQIRMENDKVAKRLEFDITRKCKSQNNTPLGSPILGSRIISTSSSSSSSNADEKNQLGLIEGFDQPVSSHLSDANDDVFLINDMEFGHHFDDDESDHQL